MTSVDYSFHRPQKFANRLTKFGKIFHTKLVRVRKLLYRLVISRVSA